MTNADAMIARWLDDPMPIEDPTTLAQQIDPRVRVEGFLYTNYQRFIFPDGSTAVLSNGQLKKG